ncbi:MAG: glycerophosphodiester phosphodiesterase [Candidatus Sulfotelmatobacter sp.]|jgi:glycerophosphoryl diester phosphodiesterase
MSRPLLLGHRGARGLKSIPENTLAAFDRALADGCDGFEFDVRLTADGQAVVHHDPKTGDLEIARATAPQLPTLLRLHDVLARYPIAFLDIELKVPGLEKVVIEAVRKCQPQRFVVSSFLPEVLETLHVGDASIPLGLISETRVQLLAWDRLSVTYLIPHRGLVDQDLIREVQAAGKKVMVWTLNAAAEMKQFAACGVDGIISDNSSLLCRMLAE